MKGRKNSAQVVCNFHDNTIVFCTWSATAKGEMHSIPGVNSITDALDKGYSPPLLLPQFCSSLDNICNAYKGHALEKRYPKGYQ